jgi:hypothetical protein
VRVSSTTCLSLATAHSQLLSLIGSPDDIAHLRSISVSPDPPEPGKDLTLTVDGYATETIEVRKFPHC